MNIVWHGQSFFEITIKSTQWGCLQIALDPYDEEIGLKVPKVEADIVLISHQHKDHSNIKAIKGVPERMQSPACQADQVACQRDKPFLITGPGEYEIKNIFIKGIPGFHDATEGKERGEVIIYKIEAEGINLCHLSDLGQKELSSEQLEELGDVDILLVPVGGVYTVGAREAAAIVSQIEPRLVIPMHYKIPKLKIQLDGPEKFLKIMGKEDITPEKRLKVHLKDLPKEETEIAMLTP